MALRYIDLETCPDRAEIAKSVHASHEPVVLRESGEEIAVISPVEGASSVPVARSLTGDDLRDLLSVEL